MRYDDFLQALHETLQPPTYLEIGVRHGRSLSLARCPAVGIDPSYELRHDIGEQVSLFKETSDDYFARPEPLEPLGGRPVAMSFIDGMHLVEYALRDFINVERHTAWSSVVVFDDILPCDTDQAARDRHTYLWTGDVFKIVGILAKHRPDLLCLRVDTDRTGLLVVLGLDPTTRVLSDGYDRIVERAVTPDPQSVPRAVLGRRGTLDPEAVLSSSLLPWLREARDAGVGAEQGRRELQAIVRRELGVSRGRIRHLLRASPA